ncbi:MAG: flagellar basal-body MS-ring/collar protein FliF [Candidatus Binatia bacterium]
MGAVSSLSPEQKSLLMRGGPVLFLALGVGFYFLQHVYYRPLFTGLSPQDAAAVVGELDARKIPFTLQKDGSTIEVPEEMLYRTRLELAGKGLPMGGGVGFEIFEQTPFGATEFTQRVNYQRALQGELSRTINALSAVQSSRVHLALPARSAFLGREEKPSASVVVELKPGYHLTSEQVQGIINLLATSVEGLATEKVTVVDTSGRPLQAREEKTDTETEFLHRLKLQIEQEMERRIETMLEPVLGVGKTVARVSAELEFRETQLAREEFDPAGHVVRSQQLQTEGSMPQPSGIPGVQANIPNGDTVESKDPNTNRKNETVNYEISRTTSQVLEPRGQIRRLSVAVLVDGKYEADTYVPRPTEEMESLKAIVMKAVGFNVDRGDQLEVANIPFQKVDAQTSLPVSPLGDLTQWARSPVGMGVIGGGAVFLLLLFKLVFRRKKVTERPVGVQSEQLPIEQSQEEGEQAVDALPGPIERIMVSADPHQVQLAQIAQDYPEMTVQIMRLWLQEGQKAVPAKEKEPPRIA